MRLKLVYYAKAQDLFYQVMKLLKNKCNTYVRPLLPDITLQNYAYRKTRQRSSSFSISESYMKFLTTFEIEDCVDKSGEERSGLSNLALVLDFELPDELD